IVTDASPSISPTLSPQVTLTIRRLSSPTPTLTPQASLRATTPAPSEAAPESPTPVLYIVQPDDTLGDIALRFDIAPAALAAANPGVDARALLPGQALLIPLAGRVALDATPALLRLALDPPTCYETLAETVLC